MGDVININSLRNDPHISGDCSCMACDYKWVGLAPAGTVWLECPKCHTYKGLFKFSAQREGDHLTCDCGNDLLHVIPKGIYCPKCGMDFDYIN